jgi:mannose-6-phosphate isomerase-like protein (cupin superfamily)
MTSPAPAAAATAVGADAETIRIGPNEIRLLLDAPATGGALSAHKVQLRGGSLGANPHLHRRSSEVFYVLKGSFEMLAGERIFTATEGDLVVVPPGVPHAFAASDGCDGDLLVFITPGVERFDIFRDLIRIAAGELHQAAYAAASERQFDTHSVHAANWSRTR